MRRVILSKPLLTPRRETLILGILLLLLGLGLVAIVALQHQRQAAAPPKIPAEPVAGAQIKQGFPGFDVIRVTRDGRAVLAGRAAPGARVVVKSGDLVIGETRADKHGDWVMIPENPLKPGAHVLTLSMQQGAQGAIISKDSAVISVPQRADGDVFVAISRQGGASRILDQGLPKAAPPGVNVAAIDLAPDGGAILSGQAEPGQRIIVYLDNRPAGEALADDKGRWELAYSGELEIGAHILRADQVDLAGKVVLRAEAGFTRAEQDRLVMGVQQVMVIQGNALWEIARRIYGSGVAYSIIFAGNKQQIRDPDLIYPGQIFDIPARDAQNQLEPRPPAPKNTMP